MNVLATVLAPIVQSYVLSTKYPDDFYGDNDVRSLTIVSVDSVWSRLLSVNLLMVACCTLAL
jgi:hypothetical protein